jgi:uncharacterized membrane protein YtjA (UPF0391 family)
MLIWALLFLIVAIIAGFLGFGDVASTATAIATCLFFLFLALFRSPRSRRSSPEWVGSYRGEGSLVGTPADAELGES